MNRYRNWVGALHWGQLLLLVPSLLFVGVAVGGGAYLSTIDSSASAAVGEAETELREFREHPFSPRAMAQDDALLKVARNEGRRKIDSGEITTQDQYDAFMSSKGLSKPKAVASESVAIDADLVRAVENAQAAKERMDSRGAWVLGVGMFGWAFSWITAFLTLWWWFGAKAKPRESQ
jgi:hypothetical protein